MNDYVTEKSKPTELENCHFVKMVLMLLVVLCHSVSFWGGNWFQAYKPSTELYSMKIISGWTGAIHVYGFVFVSGYLFFHLRETLGKYQDFTAFIKNKTKRLIIPYCFVCVVWVIPISVYFYHYSIKDIIVYYALGISPSQLWFLLVIFWCYVICWILFKYVKSDALCIAISIFLYIIGTAERQMYYDFFSLFRGLQFVSFFTCGYLIRKHTQSINHKLLLIVCLCLHIALYLISLSLSIDNQLKAAYDLLLHLVSAVFIFELLQYIAGRIKWQDNKTIRVLIHCSMPIYLFHQQIIYFIISVLNNKTHPVVISVLCFILSVSVSTGIACIIRKSRTAAILIGDKQ